MQRRAPPPGTPAAGTGLPRRGPRAGGLAGEKDGREGQDQDHSRNDETRPRRGSRRPVRAKRHAQKIANCVEAGPGRRFVVADGILELLGRDPPLLIDAHPAQQCDMGRWAAESDAAQAAPLSGDGPERHPRFRAESLVVFLSSLIGNRHRGPSAASSRSCSFGRLERTGPPLAVATYDRRVRPVRRPPSENRMSPSASMACRRGVSRSDPGLILYPWRRPSSFAIHAPWTAP